MYVCTREIFVRKKKSAKICVFRQIYLPLHRKTGKSCTACSLRIPQGLTAARVVGCSGAMQIAFPPASLAQLARARDL